MSANEFDSDLARRKFAEERAHKDAEVSNENIRATAQAAILINGVQRQQYWLISRKTK